MDIMATKRGKKKIKEVTEETVMTTETTVSSMPVRSEKKQGAGRWAVWGWGLLLLGGLGHMLPEQMAPLLKWSVWGVSVQMAVGVLSVILALNFLLED